MGRPNWRPGLEVFMRSGRSHRPFRSPTRSWSRALAVALPLTLATAALASADELRPWIGIQGSLATFGMSDVNDDIGNVNSGLAGTGLSMDEIHGGFGVGASGGIEFRGPFSAGVGYERLFASTDVGDFSASLKYDLPANVYRGFAQYAFVEGPTTTWALGSALGIVSEAGKVTLTVTGVGSDSAHLKGSGPLVELFAAGDAWASPQLALSGSVGFRYAKVGEVTVDGNTLYTPNGDKYTVDYTGLYARIGMKFAMGQ